MANIRKRIIALSLAAASLLQLSVAAGAAESYAKGDVNGDGSITLSDSIDILRAYVDIIDFTEEQFNAADVNDDGKINLIDCTAVQQYHMGIIKDFSDIKNLNNNNNDNNNNNNNNNNVKPNTDFSDYETGFGNNAYEDTSITVSGTSYSVPSGMTLYVTANDDVEWGTSNTAIATVDENGLILGKNPGKCKIIALDGGSKRTINLTVTASEAVRTVYSSPNSAVTGSTVKFIATTDQSKSAVRFDVNINGTTKSVNASSKVADNEHGIYTWTGSMTINTPGTFNVTTYSQTDGNWSTCDNGKTTTFISDSTSASATSLSTRRASDDLIRLIADFEGGLEEAEYDPIAAGNVMNYGYGVVIGAGEKFYNRASMEEYFADLVNQINEKAYSSYVNSFLQENSIKYNQYQFDALVCFTYNCGVYALQNAGLKSILLDCYEGNPSVNTTSKTAVVDVDGYLNLRSGAGTNYSVIGKLYSGDQVTVVDSKRVNGVWVKVKAPDGTVGYCSSDYLIFGGSSSNGGSRNFDYIDRNALITELMAWHHAGSPKQCYWGLLNRRIDELEMFFFGDYTHDGHLNTNGWKYPNCIMGY